MDLNNLQVGIFHILVIVLCLGLLISIICNCNPNYDSLITKTWLLKRFRKCRQIVKSC